MQPHGSAASPYSKMMRTHARRRRTCPGPCIEEQTDCCYCCCCYYGRARRAGETRSHRRLVLRIIMRG